MTRKSTLLARRRQTSADESIKKGRKARHLQMAARAAKLYAAASSSADQPKISVETSQRHKLHTRKLSFGAVTVSQARPDAETVMVNLAAGRDAFKRVTTVLSKRGVKLQLRPDVPKFRADASEKGMLIRELNGQEQRGRIIDGTFVPAE